MDLTSAYIPQIIEFTPTEFSSSVSQRPEIYVRFTLDMFVGTLSEAEATAYLNDHMVLANRASDVPYALTFVSYDARTKTVNLAPAVDLEPNTTYTITVLAGFASATGRGTTTDFTWTFTTSSTAVAKAVLSSPADASEFASLPVLNWEDIDVTPVTYHLQVSESPLFTATVYNASGLAISAFDALSSQTILPGRTYYWRVRGISGATTGEWSDVRSFCIRVSESSGSLFDTFGLISHYPPDGASNLASWPQVRLVFNSDVDPASVAGGIAVTTEHVDTGEAGTAPTIQSSVTGSLVVLTLSDDIADNTRYDFVVSGVQSASGTALSETATFTFTGPYTPLYSSARILRGTYGRFLGRYTDEELNFQAHRSSIKCNRLVNDAGSSPIADLLVAETVTFDMAAYVESHAAYCLLQSYLYEILQQAGRRNQLDMLGVSVEARLVDDIGNLLKQLEKEVKRLETTLKGAPSPVSGVRSEQWDPSSLYNDGSIGGLGRGKF